MCGILGWNLSAKSGLTVNQRRIMASVLITHMDDRGGDSFGYYKNGYITKDTGTAAYGVNVEDIARSRAVFLHTRKATVGDVTPENAHPFRSQGIVGVHNGGVANHRDLNHHYARDFEVDSMHIFAQIADNLPLEELRASGAIVFVDEDDNPNKHYLCRFNGGSLVIAGIGPKENAEAVVFASTRDALESALGLARVDDYFWYKTEDGVLYWAVDGTLKVHTPAHRLRFGERWSYTNNVRVHDKRRVMSYDSRNDQYWNRVAQGGGTPGLDGPWRPNDDDEPEGKVIDITGVTYNYSDYKKSETGVATKHFIATRKKALQGFYKDKKCSFCRLMRANVMCTLSNLVYCMNCWRLVEKCSPFVDEDVRKLVNAHIESTDILNGSQKAKDGGEHALKCELCYDEDPRWYDKITQVLVGRDCYIAKKFQIGDVVLLAGYGTLPEATPCVICDKDFAIVKHVSFTEGKTLECCLECFKNEIEVDDANILEAKKAEIEKKQGALRLLGPVASPKEDQEEEGKVSKSATGH